MSFVICAIVVALGFYGIVHAQSATPTVTIPLRPLAPLSSVKIPPVFGLEGILADKVAAVKLGKALFWDMQAGSDDIQACASCHFNAGADSRAINEVNPGQAGGDNSFQLGTRLATTVGPNYHYKAGTAASGFGGYHDGDFPFHKVADPNNRYSVTSDVNDVSGSQGVFATNMGNVLLKHTDAYGRPSKGNMPGGATTSVENTVSTPDPVFSFPDPVKANQLLNTRKTTGRNTPSVVNAVFNYRNFWDGRAQNVCNGANPFGARDQSPHLLVYDSVNSKLGPVFVGMQNSALCSQALGPILSGTEMSAANRDLKQVGRKLLARRPLAKQMVDSTDSVLGLLSNGSKLGLTTSYAALIQKAFLPEWWDFPQHVCIGSDGSNVGTVDPTKNQTCPANTEEYSQMEYNFSLFWGLSIQMYEGTLVADQTPLDKYLEGQQSYNLIGDNDRNSYTIQLKPGIVPNTISVVGLNPNLDFSDQDIFAFDDGYGRFVGNGVDGTVSYGAGSITINFETPPVSSFPIKISYSVGSTPMTPGQLRGLLTFETKGRCVVCHGGPELSNAAVDTVTAVPLERMVMGDQAVRVYDTGFYHIGVRAGADDSGLAGADPVAAMPLSLAEELRQRACNDPASALMIPGRPGDGITQAPINCGDDIARTGFFKTPQLRNVALTAPYFHNGGQLTLEQVVEFYNRGADFNLVTELQIMDPDIEPLGLGLTLQEKQDLVDFLKNALTDPRTVKQAAPFDHPQLFTPHGHPTGPHGYPVEKDPLLPGQATTQFMEVPATGAKGGKPLQTFLENIQKPSLVKDK
jgi:cytochrome c peroxidase